MSLHNKLVVSVVVALMLTFSCAKNTLGEINLPTINIFKLLPEKAFLVIKVKPNIVTKSLERDAGLGEMTNIIKEVGIDKIRLAQYTAFCYDISWLEKLKKGQLSKYFLGVIFEGDFENATFERLMPYDHYSGYDIYYSDTRLAYYARLSDACVVVSAWPQVLFDVIDVHTEKAYSAYATSSGVIKKLKPKIMLAAPISVMLRAPEKWTNISSFLNTLISFGKVTMGFSHYIHFTFTLDGSQLSKMGYFEGMVVNVLSVGYREYYNFNILFSDKLAPRFLAGALDFASLIPETKRDQLWEIDVATHENFLVLNSVPPFESGYGFDEDARADLKNAYTAAMAYIAHNPTAGFFTLEDLKKCGFEKSPDVNTVIIDGKVNSLKIASKHKKGRKRFIVDSKGSITVSW